MTGPAATAVPAGSTIGRLGGAGGLARAAVVIAALTALGRIVGVGRWFVFSATVGTGCTGTAYATANTLPNVVFEVAAGGALAGAVVPVLAGLLSSGRRADADRAASALLTWVVLGLVPVAVMLAVAAEPLSRLIVGGRTSQDCADAAALAAAAARMVRMFAPQVVLYGIGIVLAGVLQAHRRFAGPAVAPLLSSLVVIGAYLVFGALPGHGGGGGLPDRGAELVLTGGTTVGVAALSLPLLVPVLVAGIRVRPTLRFPPGTAARLRTLALAGVGALGAQQVAVLTTMALANRVGGEGALVVVQYAQTVYLLPYAVLAVPVATAVFPRLSEHAARGRTDSFSTAVASSTKIVIAVSLFGGAVLAAAAPAVQALFMAVDAGVEARNGRALTALAEGLVWFAAGLVGWGLVAHLSRALYALGRPRPAALATAGGWAAVVVVSIVAVLGSQAAGFRPERAAVVGLAAGTSAGMLFAGALLLVALRVAAGPGATQGIGRSLLVGVVGALLGAMTGRWACLTLLGEGVGDRTGDGAGRGAGSALEAVGAGAAAGAVAVIVVGAVAWLAESGPRRDPGGVPRVTQVLATSGGGVGRHVAALASWLVAAGVPVRVAGPTATDAGFGLAATGAEFVPVEISDRPRPGADLRALVRLRGLAATTDVLHAHGLRAGALAVLAARSRRLRPRVVVTVHNALVGQGRVAAVHAVLVRIVARGADVVLVVSGDLGEKLRRSGARRVDRALVPAPHRPVSADVAATRAALALSPGEKLLVTVARLAPQKGLPLLLDAVAVLVRDNVPVRAMIAGDGPLETELAGEIARRGLPLTLLGLRDDIPELLAAAEVVVVPSVWEGQPLVVQEALRAAAAIVATDVGGVAEVVGDAALLVPYGQPVELATAVATLLDDPDALAKLRERARSRARELPTDDDAGEQALALYRG